MSQELLGVRTSRSMPRPTHEKGYAMSAFSQVSLLPTQRTIRQMTVVRLYCAGVHGIGPIWIQDAAVVARDDNECPVGKLEAVETIQESADGCIKLLDHIAAYTGFTRVAKPIMGHSRHVNIVCCEVQKKGSRLMLFDEIYRLFPERVRHV